MKIIQTPKKVRAAILVEQNQPLIVDEIELPDALAYGQVLVRVLYSGICGSQLGEISGVKGPDAYLPHLLGHEGCGLVVQIGPGVKYVKPGEKVVLHWKKGKGIESEPPKYRWKGKTLNAGFVTTFNEYAIISENRLTPLPSDYDAKTGSLYGCAITTGLGAIIHDAHAMPGNSVVIFGAGGVGLNMIQGAVLVSAYPIIAVDLFDSKLELAKKLGATHIINSKNSDPEEQIRNILGKGGADVVIDNTGNTSVISLAYRLTAPQGTTLLVGVPKKGDQISIYSLPLHFGQTLRGSFGGDTIPERDIPRYLRLEQCGKLNLEPLITETFSLDQINVAIERMRSGALIGRCAIKLSDEKSY